MEEAQKTLQTLKIRYDKMLAAPENNVFPYYRKRIFGKDYDKPVLAGFFVGNKDEVCIVIGFKNVPDIHGFHIWAKDNEDEIEALRDACNEALKQKEESNGESSRPD